MNKQKRAKIVAQVKRDRAARREAEISLGLPKVHAQVWRTSKRDQQSRKQIPNTVRGL